MQPYDQDDDIFGRLDDIIDGAMKDDGNYDQIVKIREEKRKLEEEREAIRRADEDLERQKRQIESEREALERIRETSPDAGDTQAAPQQPDETRKAYDAFMKDLGKKVSGDQSDIDLAKAAIQALYASDTMKRARLIVNAAEAVENATGKPVKFSMAKTIFIEPFYLSNPEYKKINREGKAAYESYSKEKFGHSAYVIRIGDWISPGYMDVKDYLDKTYILESWLSTRPKSMTVNHDSADVCLLINPEGTLIKAICASTKDRYGYNYRVYPNVVTEAINPGDELSREIVRDLAKPDNLTLLGRRIEEFEKAFYDYCRKLMIK